jgi:hypothetical protein
MGKNLTAKKIAPWEARTLDLQITRSDSVTSYETDALPTEPTEPVLAENLLDRKYSLEYRLKKFFWQKSLNFRQISKF